MSIARHNGIAILFRFIANYVNELGKLSIYGVAFLFKIKTNVERNLIVTASRGVKAFACLTYTRRQLALNEGVNILCIRVDEQSAAFNLRLDLV